MNAVPPEEIGHVSFATVSSLSISLMLSSLEKANYNISTCLPVTFTLSVQAFFSSTYPAQSTLLVLEEN
jgi:hypothetical protein